MSPADELLYIAVIGVVVYVVAIILWRGSKAAARKVNPALDDSDAGFVLGSFMVAMAYAAFPGGFVMLITMSWPLALGAFIVASLILWFAMFRNG
ncbi:MULTISPECIES: ABC transporter ATP-binding protein [Marivita]|uniref:Uncharacterized protein n=1 Tax=Marivita cryptomonadis TaxID=505252 RepID=A0A9Q2P4S7_9RHOB|nr:MULTISPECIES: ABC transporter ATP-binding protein [Marivita]MCR9169492.1 hypothetical protein [Paracoccaceae bacterium]MBM2322244.1 hypothetical protein [Marivita cryptomonadis]MBM2331826.1 hypothetical protein [Marivita cryptomonadis]MBM2341410.1 hypothetical protein [Marivita cryptomonadis]MBM2346074.1 hypothetical protein [Marivita cryptomonadis]